MNIWEEEKGKGLGQTQGLLQLSIVCPFSKLTCKTHDLVPINSVVGDSLDQLVAAATPLIFISCLFRSSPDADCRLRYDCPSYWSVVAPPLRA